MLCVRINHCSGGLDVPDRHLHARVMSRPEAKDAILRLGRVIVGVRIVAKSAVGTLPLHHRLQQNLIPDAYNLESTSHRKTQAIASL